MTADQTRPPDLADALDAAVADRDEARRAALEWRRRHDDLADKLAGLELAAIEAADTLQDAVEALVDDEDEEGPPTPAEIAADATPRTAEADVGSFADHQDLLEAGDA